MSRFDWDKTVFEFRTGASDGVEGGKVEVTRRRLAAGLIAAGAAITFATTFAADKLDQDLLNGRETTVGQPTPSSLEDEIQKGIDRANNPDWPAPDLHDDQNEHSVDV